MSREILFKAKYPSIVKREIIGIGNSMKQIRVSKYQPVPLFIHV